MDSSSNLFRSIALRILALVIMFSAVVFTAKADDEKNKKKEKKETAVTFSAEEKVFFEKVSKEVEAKTQKALANVFKHQTETMIVVDGEGKVILETTQASKLPANAQKLMTQGKIAFYIVNL